MFKQKVVVLLMTSVVGAGGLFAQGSWASGQTYEEHVGPAAAHHEDRNEQAAEGNSICPVTGEEIQAGEKLTVMHNGQPVALCCQYCVGQFTKNPEKYQH